MMHHLFRKLNTAFSFTASQTVVCPDTDDSFATKVSDPSAAAVLPATPTYRHTGMISLFILIT